MNTTKSGTNSGTTTTKSGTTTTKSETTEWGGSLKTIYKTTEISEPPWFIIANCYLLEYILIWIVVRSYFSNFVLEKFDYILYMYLLNFCLNQIFLFMSQYQFKLKLQVLLFKTTCTTTMEIYLINFGKMILKNFLPNMIQQKYSYIGQPHQNQK